MMNYEKNIIWAKHAITYVRKTVTLGAGNRVEDVWKSRGESLVCQILQANEDYDSVELKNHPVSRDVRLKAKFAETSRCGNCGEQAAVAFMYLYNKGIRPIDYMIVDYPKNNFEIIPKTHAFVVIGRKNGTMFEWPKKWNKEAIICDVWDMKVFPGREYYSKMQGGVSSKPDLKCRITQFPSRNTN